MTPEVEGLFHELAEHTPVERAEHYARHGVADAVRSEVERLLSFDSATDHSLKEAIGDSAGRTIASLSGGPNSGSRFGPYRVLGLLGRGGMGAVYRAERDDGEIARQVAIKTLHPAMDHAGWLDRFLLERQLLARLSHPQIARVYDAGHTEDGLPYLVMEYVEGVPIDQYTAGKSLNEAIEIVAEVCDAVAHAHRNLIIHRDLKPSNILVDQAGHPKLLDFGIAKLLDDSGGRTETADRMLTPSYASPEQIRGERQTTATDVYSLGAVLYRVATGRSPHEQEGNPQFATEIAAGRQEITAPRQVNRDLPVDIDHIVRKALRWEPEERYPSAESLASDLRRFLRHEPITARPESLAYRTARFVRRNRVAAILAGIALAVSVAGIVSTVVQARAARAQRDFAIRQLARAEEINDLNSFLLSDAAPLGKPFQVTDLLATAERIAERRGGADPASLVDNLTSIGTQYHVLDQPAKAIGVLERAYGLSRKISDAPARARATCALARALPTSGQTARAITLVREGLRELPADPIHALDRVFCLQAAASISRHAGAGVEAIESIQAAREALTQAPYHSKATGLSVMLDLAESYRIAGKTREAISTSEEAAQLMTALGRDETQRAGTLFNNWALALNLIGRQLEAEKIYRKAIDIGKSDDSERSVSPMLLLNYGRVLTDLGRHREAEAYVERAYAEAKRNGHEAVVAQSLTVKATTFRGLGDARRAVEAIEELDPVVRRVYPAGHAAYASIASQQSLNAQAIGDLANALELANRAIALTEAGIQARREGSDFLPVLLMRRSGTNRLMHRTDAAVSDARRALDLFKDRVQPGMFSSHLGRTYLALAQALDEQGNRQQARPLLESAAQHLEKSLGPEHPDYIEALRRARE